MPETKTINLVLPMMMTVKKTYEFDPEKDLVGKGGFGNVYKARDLNLDLEVAIKKYTGNLPSKYSLFEEIKRVIQLSHPNLVRYYDAFELEETSAFGDKIQVGVLEYIDGGDLTKVLKQKPNVKVLSDIFIGIMDGLRYLHGKGIIHRDLKPENILIKRENGQYIPKITDFGISKVIDGAGGGASSLVIGSVEYMAPEQFNLNKYGNKGNLATNLDLWSLGTLMYEAFTGNAPFGKTQLGFSRDEIMRNILEKDLTELHKVPQPFREVVKACLVRNAGERAQSVADLYAILQQSGGNQILGSAPTSLLSQSAPPQLQQNSPDIVSGGDPTSVLGGGAAINKLPQNDNSTKVQKPQTVAKDDPYMKRAKLKDPLPPPSDGGFKLVYLLPIITAIAGYAFFDSKLTLFKSSTVSQNYLIYPAIFCAAMFCINLFSLFFRKKVRTFEWSTYTFSFLVLTYYLVQSIILQNYDALNSEFGSDLTFKQHNGFARYFPIAGLVLVTLLQIGRVKWLHKFEPLINFLSYTFLFFILINVFYEVKTWMLLTGIAAVLSIIAFVLLNRRAAPDVGK